MFANTSYCMSQEVCMLSKLEYVNFITVQMLVSYPVSFLATDIVLNLQLCFPRLLPTALSFSLLAGLVLVLLIYLNFHLLHFVFLFLSIQIFNIQILSHLSLRSDWFLCSADLVQQKSHHINLVVHSNAEVQNEGKFCSDPAAAGACLDWLHNSRNVICIYSTMFQVIFLISFNLAKFSQGYCLRHSDPSTGSLRLFEIIFLLLTWSKIFFFDFSFRNG